MGKPERARARERKSQLGEGGLEVLDDFGGDDVGIGRVGAAFMRLMTAQDSFYVQRLELQV
jgi:hypothetical protein